LESMSLLGFVAAALVVLVIPGPGVLYVVARSLSQGQGAGLVSVLGLSVGALVHVAAATLGLSAILLASATAFGIIKFLGAAYLVYLGLAMILTRQSVAELDADEDRKLTRLFTDGVIISVLNPKIAIFFLAFLPQFVDPGQGTVPLQILFLGTLYVLLALFTDGAYAILASRIRGWLGGRVMRSSLPRYASGTAFIGLGVGTAFADRH
jgi:threonine/homoserine/homoserine lactone efflux protein